MKVMLLFLLGSFIVSLWWAKRARPARAWIVLVISFFVGVAFLSQQVI